MPIKHFKHSELPDLPDDTQVRPSDWNSIHEVTGGTDQDVIIRDFASVSDGLGFTKILALIAILFNQPEPSSPVDGMLWLSRSGTSPSRVIALKVQDGGVTYTLFEITV